MTGCDGSGRAAELAGVAQPLSRVAAVRYRPRRLPAEARARDRGIGDGGKAFADELEVQQLEASKNLGESGGNCSTEGGAGRRAGSRAKSG
jgi:hypothetical protein